MDGIKGFLNSKRGMLCLALIIAASVLAIMAIFTKDDWIAYTKWIFTAYVAGESTTKAMEIYSTKSAVEPS